MNIINIQSCKAAAVVFAALSAVACTDKGTSPSKVQAPPATAAGMDQRSKAVGVEPAGPTKEAPATTSPVESSISKAQQSNAMPLPGQANDHSTLSPQASQKPDTTKR